MYSVLNDLKPLFLLIEKLPPEGWAFIFLFGFVLFAIQWGKKRHLLCQLEAMQQLKRLKRINSPEKQLTLLRGVNPFVFEEMILTAIKKSGFQIKRNKRYTADGGIDGQATIKGVEYLIQAKRYKNYINPAHVQEFGFICKKQGKRGLFIHTGKTGAKSSKISKSHNLEMISGNRLLNMLTNSQK